MKATPKIIAALPIVLEMQRQGMPHKEIAEAAGIGKSLVARILNNLPKIIAQVA